MLEAMPATELAYWESVYQTEFLGDERQDYRFGRIEAQIGNYSGKIRKEDAPDLSPLDCMAFSSFGDKAEKTPEQEADRIDFAFGAIMGMQAAEEKERKERSKATAKSTTAEDEALAILREEAERRMKAARQEHGME